MSTFYREQVHFNEHRMHEISMPETAVVEHPPVVGLVLRLSFVAFVWLYIGGAMFAASRATLADPATPGHIIAAVSIGLVLVLGTGIAALVTAFLLTSYSRFGLRLANFISVYAGIGSLLLWSVVGVIGLADTAFMTLLLVVCFLLLLNVFSFSDEYLRNPVKLAGFREDDVEKWYVAQRARREQVGARPSVLGFVAVLTLLAVGAIDNGRALVWMMLDVRAGSADFAPLLALFELTFLILGTAAAVSAALLTIYRMIGLHIARTVALVALIATGLVWAANTALQTGYGESSAILIVVQLALLLYLLIDTHRYITRTSLNRYFR